MRRHSRPGDKPVKKRHSKTATPKRGDPPKAVRHRNFSATFPETQVARLTRELQASLARENATSEVLRIISSSPGELKLIFNAMLENAVSLCEAEFGNLFLYDGEAFHAAAVHSASQAYTEVRRRPVVLRELHPDVPIVRMARTKAILHIADVKTERSYERDPIFSEFVDVSGARTVLYVPMVKENELTGAFVIYRLEVRRFTDKQIALVQNFAAQAVIAVENARLLNELRESLQQQTATADVLKVISRSTFDLPAVLNTLVESAVRLCDGYDAVILLREGGLLTFGAHHGPIAMDFLKWPLTRNWTAGRAVLDKAPIHVHDLSAAGDEFPEGQAMALRLGHRTILSVPLLRDDEAIGSLTVRRKEVRPFTDKQIELVQTFADQAVIAIENVRLFEAEQQRTRELSESLEQQTATSEVLRVISSSPGELQPVFEAMLANAVRLCEASYGALWLREGAGWRNAAFYGELPEAYTGQWRSGMVTQAGVDAPMDRVARSRKPVHIPDCRTDHSYLDGHPLFVNAVDVGGIRTYLGVPMLKANEIVGVVAIYRTEVRPFTDKQSELVTNFAAQAVIAIENARLLSELRQSLQQQTATADVLKIISRSTFDLKTVLNTLVESAARLCEADMASVPRVTGGILDHFASYGYSPDFHEFLQNNPTSPGRGTVSGRAVLEGRTVHIPDVLADPEYDYGEGQKVGGYRTLLGVPLMREGAAVGALVLGRAASRPFTPQQIELVETFADQAVIAIENVRLFEAEQQRTRELTKSLDDLRTAQDRLVHTQKLASLGQLTAGIAHEIKNPLNFVNNFSGVSTELIGELQEALGRVKLDDKTLSEITELATTLRENLDKIAQHGKRADAIVKNMQMHSRESSGERRSVDVNALVEESLNLAYHGARAEKQGFSVTIERSYDPSAGAVDAFPQELTRVLLNLISNGFYAATKRQGQEGGNGFEPTITAATKSLGDRVEIRIRDNGIGIPPEVREKMFNPFFTTKPAGEGTGLGLSISHDIIVKQHSGSIEVDSEPGQFAEFRVILRRTAA